MRRLPIKAARDFAKLWGLDQVIIVAWDSRVGLTHVVTYGRTLRDCEQAALGGNKVKAAIGFPPEACNTKPARVHRAALKLAGADAPNAR